MKKDNKIVVILSKIKRFKDEKIKKEFKKISLYVLTVCLLCFVTANMIFELRGVKNAYCLYINKEPVIAMDTKRELEEILEDIKNAYKKEDNSVSFSDDVKIAKVLLEKDFIKNEKEAEEFFIKNMQNDEPILKVRAVSYESKTEEIKFDTKIKTDDTKYKGDTTVLKDGKNGEKSVVYEVVEENGSIIYKRATEETVIKEPETKIVVAGTKTRPKNVSTGTFTRPYSGNISSRFGSRWGRKHHGIDYTGNVGDPIYAADGGEVIFAGWDNSGYGNMVKIKHKDGYETFYAHMNEVKVKTGQKVSQNDIIGTLGNTGRSTGPHLHFEIRKDGVAHDPQKFTK